MVDVSTGGDPAAEGDTRPQHATTRPAGQEAASALADGNEDVIRGVGDRRFDLDCPDDPVIEVVGGDRGDLVADVDAEGQEVGDVEFER